MTPQERGYWFENEVVWALKKLQAESPCVYHRFPDSKSARNIIAAQPGDHLLIAAGRAYLIEEKASTKHSSFRSCTSMVSPHQKGSHIKWLRAGGRSLFFFYSEQEALAEIWDGLYLVTAWQTGTRLHKDAKPLAVVPIDGLEQAIKGVVYEK